MYTITTRVSSDSSLLQYMTTIKEIPKLCHTTFFLNLALAFKRALVLVVAYGSAIRGPVLHQLVFNAHNMILVSVYIQVFLTLVSEPCHVSATSESSRAVLLSGKKGVAKCAT